MWKRDVNFHRIANSSKNIDVQKIFTILAQGEDEFCHLNLCKKTANVTLILGTAESGKTAFAHWMSEKDVKFESKEDPLNPGGYFIFDPDGEVGNPSATCVPKVVTNNNTGQVYYDFSGFFDSRGEAYDIATTYFTKKAIENVTNVKICFLINYFSVTRGGTRDEFTNSLNHIVTMIKDIEKFQQSVILVATKVNNQYSNYSKEDIALPMVNFLELVKQNQKNVTNLKTFEFLDKVTAKKGGMYPSIALFRSPNKEAFLRNISVMQENKKQLGEILQNLVFTKMNTEDFAYAVPKSSLFNIINIMEEERHIIITDIARSSNQIKKYFLDKEEIPVLSNEAPIHLSMMFLQRDMKFGYQSMLKIKNSTSMSNVITENPKECLTKIINGIANMSRNSINLHLTSTLDECDALHFLQTITGQFTKLDCAKGLENVMQYLKNSQTWYLFFNHLYDRLLNCNISKDMGVYNITEKDANKRVSETNLKQFLLKDPQEPLYFLYNDIKDITLTKFKFKSLQIVANLTTVYRQTNLLCTGNNLTQDANLMIEDFYGTRGYLNDLYLLENQLYTAENRTWFLPFYKSLSGRVEKYIEKISQNNTFYGDFKVLRYLQTAIASRICILNNDLDNYLAVDIREYFGLVDQHLSQYTAAWKNLQIRTYKDNYEDVINRQILQAFVMVQKTILPEVDRINDQIFDEIQQVIKVIKELEKQGVANIKELLEQRNKLAAQLPLVCLMGVLKVATIGLCFLGPLGVVAAGASGLAIGAAEAYLLPTDKTAESVIDASKKLAVGVKDYYKLEKEKLGKLLENVAKINELSDGMEQIKEDKNYKKIDHTVNSLKKLLDQKSIAEKDYFDKKTDIKKELQQHREQLKKEKEDLEHNTDTDTDTKPKIKQNDALNGWLSRVETTVSVAEAGVKAFQEYKKSEELVSQIDGQIDHVKDVINMLKDYEQNIRNKLVPEMGNISKNVTNVLVNSANQSHIVLDRNRFMLKNLLTDFRVEIEIMLSSINQEALKPIQKHVLGCIDKLENGISTTLQIYDRVQDYQNQAGLANFIAGLHSVEYYAEDPNLKDDINNLELLIKSNLILREYEQAWSMYKLYTFPFAQIYLTKFDISPYLKPANVTDRVIQAQNDIKQLHQDFIEMDAVVFPHKDAIFSDERFDTQNGGQEPFFIWHYNIYKEEISKLLKGSRATLQANILESNLAPYAIKFKEIGIRFLLQNQTAQSELQQLMNDFKIEMTHLGNSHYGCGSKYYIVNHNKLKMIHSMNSVIGSQNNLEYGNADDTTKKIRTNRPLFSPYADWEFQLQSRSISVKEDNFEILKNFQNVTVDVVLEGRGSHIQRDVKACKQDLSKYYRYGGALLERNHAKTSRRRRAAIDDTHFNINEWLTWADFLFRWLTGVKLSNNAMPVSYVNSTEARALALNLIHELEQILHNASEKFNVPFESLSFEVVPLMSELEKKAASGNRTIAGDILYQFIINNNPNLYNSSLGNYIRDEIDKMLKQENYF